MAEDNNNNSNKIIKKEYSSKKISKNSAPLRYKFNNDDCKMMMITAHKTQRIMKRSEGKDDGVW